MHNDLSEKKLFRFVVEKEIFFGKKKVFYWTKSKRWSFKNNPLCESVTRQRRPENNSKTHSTLNECKCQVFE